MIIDFFLAVHFTYLSIGFRQYQLEFWAEGEKYCIEIHFLFFTLSLIILRGQPYDEETTEGFPTFLEDET